MIHHEFFKFILVPLLVLPFWMCSIETDRRIPDTWRTDLLCWTVLLVMLGLAIWPGIPIAMYLISEWALQ